MIKQSGIKQMRRIEAALQKEFGIKDSILKLLPQHAAKHSNSYRPIRSFYQLLDIPVETLKSKDLRWYQLTNKSSDALRKGINTTDQDAKLLSGAPMNIESTRGVKYTNKVLNELSAEYMARYGGKPPAQYVYRGSSVLPASGLPSFASNVDSDAFWTMHPEIGRDYAFSDSEAGYMLRANLEDLRLSKDPYKNRIFRPHHSKHDNSSNEYLARVQAGEDAFNDQMIHHSNDLMTYEGITNQYVPGPPPSSTEILLPMGKYEDHQYINLGDMSKKNLRRLQDKEDTIGAIFRGEAPKELPHRGLSNKAIGIPPSLKVTPRNKEEAQMLRAALNEYRAAKRNEARIQLSVI